MNTIKICATGHRPNKLPGGYDNNSEKNMELRSEIEDVILHYLSIYDSVHMISGMALGVDTLFALVAIKLKEEGNEIILEAAIPCLNQEKMWSKESQEIWSYIREKSDVVTYVSDDEYTDRCMHDRNQYMVSSSDLIVVVMKEGTGIRSGTYSTYLKAEKAGLETIIINP